MVWIISHRAMALSFGYGRMPRKKNYPFKLPPPVAQFDYLEIFSAPLLADINMDGIVDDADLLLVLFDFGATGACMAADLNRDGIVDDADLLQVLFHFGSGC
jgi:hypothetical protein